MTFFYLKKGKIARCQWLPPVILATWESEIRRIVVESQPAEMVHKTLSQNYPNTKKGGEVAQVVEPHSNPNAANKKKKEK
jgi:hypothetical protein